MDNFFTAPTDFSDLDSFLIVHKNGLDRSKTLPEISGFSMYESDFGHAWCNVDEHNPFDGLLLGATFDRHEVLAGPLSGNNQGRFPDLETGAGEYCLVETVESALLFTTDAFGKKTLFYGECGGMTVVSNRLLLIAEFNKAMGQKMSLDMGSALLQNLSDTAIAMHSFVRRTVFKGINYLVPGQEIQLSFDGSISIHTQDDRQSPVSADEYNAEILKAAANITQRVDAMGAYFEKITVSLTAGLDSRAALAAVLGSSHRSKALVFTRPNHPVDSFGSHLIREKYDIPLHDDFSETTFQFETDEIMKTVRRDLIIGFATNQETRAGYSARSFLSPSLNMGGGGGECFRDFYSKRFSKHAFVHQNYSYDTSSQFIALLATANYSEGSRNLMADGLDKELSLTPGETFLDRLEKNYLFHRNRFHFSGLEKRLVRGGKFGFTCLMDADLLRLSHRVDSRVRESKKIILDLSEALYPGITQELYNDELAAKYNITVPKKIRGSIENKYDNKIPAEFSDKARDATALREQTLSALYDDAIQIVAEIDEFREIFDFGLKRTTWMRKIPAHKFRNIWYSRIINLAKISVYI